MKKLRILLVHNYYQIKGGEDYCFEEELKLLRSAGHRVIEYTRKNDEISDGNKFDLLLNLFWSRRAYSEVGKILSDGSIDIMHVHNFFPVISPSVYQAAVDHGVPVVQTLHNYRLACANALLLRDGAVCEDCLGHKFGFSGVRHRCYRSSRIASLMVTSMTSLHAFLGTWSKKVDCFIVPSQFVYQKIIEHGLEPDKVKVRPNVVSDVKVSTNLVRYGGVYIGRLSSEKGVRQLIDCWKREFPDKDLRVIGDGPELEELTSLVKGSKIHLLGGLAREKCLEALASAEVLVMPSVCYETFGRTVIEAYSVGTPVVVPNGGALEELVKGDFLGGIFKMGCASSLGNKIREVIDRPDDAQTDSIKEFYEKHYASSRIHNETMEIYKSLVR
jgi:glycosyltransferase involved in cell wall biosynthesis